MSFKSRLMTSAFVLPVTGLLTLNPAMALDVTGLEADTAITAPVKTSDTPADAQSIIIDGTPTSNNGAALLIDSDDVDVIIDGAVGVRSHKDDGTATDEDLQAATVIKITGADNGRSLRLKSEARLIIVEGASVNDRRGPDYDGDDDNLLPDENDEDVDGIVEGSLALGNFERIGLWVDAAMGEALIGEAGSQIVVYGDGDSDDIVAGVLIDGALGDNLDLSANISLFGDNARGVDINSSIGGNYRQRGDIDVRGEGGVGIDVGGVISGSLIIEGLVNATGYSTAPEPLRGPDESELTAAQQTANSEERRRGGSAINVGANIDGGILINGLTNSVPTGDEQEALQTISDRRTDDDNSNDDVTSLKTLPYHFDENRASGRVTSYGEADGEASLKITASVGTLGGATIETFLDTADDDDDDTAASTDDGADLYDSTQSFYYSHGLMNRGSIEANSWYDAVKSGSYQIDNKATAVLIDDGANDETIHGGIYNSGRISATAYNSNAIALDIVDVELTDGQRDDNSVFLNEGTLAASVETNTRSHDTVSESNRSATAVKIGAGVSFDIAGATPVFTNAGGVSAVSSHARQVDADDSGSAYEVVGDLGLLSVIGTPFLNAENLSEVSSLNTADVKSHAFDLSAVALDFNLTQRLLVADETVSDAPNSTNNPYKGGGDLDIDRVGAEDDDGNVIGDNKIDTRDVGAPYIAGDIKFNNAINIFTVTAGTVLGHVDFGAGNDSLALGNSMADDADEDYTALTTVFRGRISNSETLDIIAGNQPNIDGERTRLHFEGQEGIDLNGDGDDDDQDEEFSELEINNLDLNENAELRFTINPDFLAEDEAVLKVTNFTMDPEVTLSLDISRLVDGEGQSRDIVLVEADNNLSAYAAGINDRAPDDQVYPFIYNVSLGIEDNTKLVASFALKDGDALGLNAAESEAFDTVLTHFTDRARLESAMTGLISGDDFRAAYKQLLPQYGDGTMKQLANLAQSATGAVSQHLQIVEAGGRRGGDGWLQQFGDYRKQDAGAQTNTLSGTSYGLAFGFDAPAGIVDAVGAFGQMSFTSVNEKTAAINEVNSESFVLGGYLADAIGPLRYELNASAGSVNFESRRFITFNGVQDSLTAGWEGTSTSASMRLAYPILDMRHLLRLEAGMDYFSLEQDAYSEKTGFTIDPELAMQIGESEADMSSNYIGLRGGLRTGGGSPSEVVWEPNYYVGYRSAADYTPSDAQVNFVGTASSFMLQGDDEASEVAEIGLGIGAHNDYFAFEFTYRGQFGDDVEVHGGGISVRLLF